MNCQAPSCERAAKSNGFCQKHYMRLWRTGSIETTKRRNPEKPRYHFMYGAWAGMVNRCHNPNNSSYARYGGNGTTVCDRWRSGEDGKIGFVCFLEDMGERPDGMTLDRIDPAGNYEPSNCRWATIAEQRRNRTPEGDKRMRDAIRASRLAYWAKRRQKYEVPSRSREPKKKNTK